MNQIKNFLRNGMPPDRHRGCWVMGCLFALLLGSMTNAQSAEDFPIPTSMKVEGVPAIKKSDVEHLFFEPSKIKSNLLWDADRANRTLLVTDERTEIYLLRSPLSSPEKLIDGRVPHTVRMSPNGGSFAFTDDKEDADNFELYLWSQYGDGQAGAKQAEATIRKLSTFSGKDESIESVLWDKTGVSLFYTQADYDTKTSKVLRRHISLDRSGAETLLSDLKGIWSVLDTNEDKLLLKYWKASSEQSLHLYDLKTRELTRVGEEGNLSKGFFAQGRLFWIVEGDRSCASDPCVLSMDLKSGVKRQISLPKGSSGLQDIKASPDGKSFLIHETRDGIDNLRIGRLVKDKLVDRVPPFMRGAYVVWNTRWLSEKEVVYTTENIAKPASIQSFDLSSRKTTVWTKERLPMQLEGKARDPEVIKWKSFDDRQISGYAIRPKDIKQKTPVVILVHGGPQVVDRPVFNSQDLRFVVNLGLTVIHTNIRGSKGFGNEFMDADNGLKRGDAVRDIRSLLDWIETQPDLDPRQIYIRGESYGGFIALAAGLQEPKRLKGVIAEFPLVSIRGFLSQSWIDEFAKSEYGDPKDERLMSQLDGLSPLNNASLWNGIPLFLTRGKLDARVPEKDVLDLKSQLQARGSEVWFLYATEAAHGVGGRYVTAAMYEFLKKQIRRNNN